MIIKSNIKVRMFVKMKVVLRKLNNFLKKLYVNYDNFFIGFVLMMYFLIGIITIYFGYIILSLVLAIFLPTIILHFWWDE